MGQDGTGGGPEMPDRRCIVTGESRPTAGMVRFVVGPDETLVPDLEERLPGRGLWLSAERDMIHTACQKKLFARAARQNVRVPADLAERVEALLARRCIDLIGLARRADQVVAGFEKVQAWLRAGKGGLLIAASDGAEGGRAKMRALAADAPVVEQLTAAEIGGALGRDHVVHAAVAHGRLADRLTREALRLGGFRQIDGTAA